MLLGVLPDSNNYKTMTKNLILVLAALVLAACSGKKEEPQKEEAPEWQVECTYYSMRRILLYSIITVR